MPVAPRVEVRTRAELLRDLGSRRRLDEALGQGTWHRVLHGVYATGPGPDELDVRVTAARRVLPVRCVVADRCLLWLLGVDVLPPGPPLLEVVVPRGAVVPRRPGLRAREAAVPATDRWLLDGRLAVLRPARAVVDLARALPLVEGVVAADAVQCAGLLTLPALQDEVERHAALRGVRRARAVLALSDGRAESPPETRLRVLLVQHGLQPVPQHEVRDAAGRWLGRVDLAFPDARVAVEYDGRDVHLRTDAFVHERRRQNALLAAGWTVLRYTAHDLRERPAAVLAEVRAALRRAT